MASPPWEKLPPEIAAAILHKLGAVEILTTAQKVCPTWRRVSLEPSMWRCIKMEHSRATGRLYDLKKMCRHAVDLSRGQLTDITIHSFCTNDLLLYISQRSIQLSRLCLQDCHDIGGDALTAALKNLPLLEELHLQNSSFDVKAIETVGRYCPLLKSFKLNSDVFDPEEACDLEALAIAENMHGLRHLELYGNKMTNVGLKAILEGCPNLESLDLRRSINVDLVGDLERLCLQRIKDLKLPHNYTRRYPWDTHYDMFCIWADVSDSEDDFFADGDSASDCDDDYFPLNVLLFYD
ncbi:hypothetical protein MIMGU_mgv1a021949mg [Erythranthe guttata]|uniref:F-box domain-containing protein n=1 Tax=Erythranthe guttata TaxID=4155 RepID=A0A022QWK4_ERYGU|nr:hypothetical protein MIMGU_mgv1a021949mg [Erythranthe guttata]